ncbi:DUF427 domain-containing protein [Saitoella complicata NRRL Y-17804]|uniref:DUF427 domain-containing protein n=1 Tax=Saitoella complicata (strain BCRC 22490 / CBS 7301 / JCM 7358 / NBRC 10748 / NRRL Y-17804) TaxID=698492 RepID=A0A0E9NBC5_SAICN|nr:DUF427 domain-containing protein [Saitoella complicata NRRL Y-17804]ODQ55344.1 DUF427 domain-containing protein [Saitoella complicata NRRL Y-17804]GAO47177.1 hypothetical protein G7K_1388-t1 [Saitoella complicata NRRL Y-17804]
MPSVYVGDTLLAQSERVERVEGNLYFPPGTIQKQYFHGPTELHTHCPWKGDASYYTVEIPGKDDARSVKLENIAWYYPEAKEGAKYIEGWVAFYKNKVEVRE